MAYTFGQQITMKTLIICTLALLCDFVSAEDAEFSGEITLTATKYMEGIMLAKEYKITITGGTASITYTDGAKEREEKGTVALTMHTGKDPASKKFTPFEGFIRVEFTKPGWVKDKTITRFDLPFTANPMDKVSKVTFSSETPVEILSTNVLPDGLVTYSDPMNIRLKSPYSVVVTKNPIVIP